MSKTRWRTRAIYTIVALVMTLGLLLVPATTSTVQAELNDGPVAPCFAIDSGSYTTYPDDDNTRGWMNGTFNGTAEEGFPMGLLGSDFEFSVYAAVGEVAHGFGCISADASKNAIAFRGHIELDKGTVNDATMTGASGEICVDGNGIYGKWGAINPAGDTITLSMGGEWHYIDPDDFELVPSLALNVKGATERYEITNCDALCGWMIKKWDVMAAYGAEVIIVDGGEPGDCWITIQSASPGEGHVAAYLDFDGNDEVDKVLDAEKKWGEINCTELTSLSTGENLYDATELVKARFIWGPHGEIRDLPADDAVVNWWLLDIAALDDIQALEATLGDDPCDDDGGCGTWTWDPTLSPEAQPEDPFNIIRDLQIDYPVTDAYFTGNGDDYIQTTTDVTGTSTVEVYAASIKGVLLVTLAEYPIDYNGENIECVQHDTFKRIERKQVKVPQVRWAGEKIVLEKDWAPIAPIYSEWHDEDTKSHGYDITLHFVVYSLEEGRLANLEAIEDISYVDIYVGGLSLTVIDVTSLGLPTGGAQQVIVPLGGGYLYFEGGDGDNEYYYGEDLWSYSVSRCILQSEKQGEADVNAALYEVTYSYAEYYDSRGNYLGDKTIVNASGPDDNHGFLVYYLAFEEVTESEVTEAAPAVSNVIVQVKGWFTSDALYKTTRKERRLDLNGDGNDDIVLEEGRWVLPDDWEILAGFNMDFRSQYDLMDTPIDDITSTNELGPYDTDVWTTDPPGEAEFPCCGPFNTLQPWSADKKWIATALVPYCAPPWERNTVVPNGDLDCFDCPMPQALVVFDVSDYNSTLDELDKGDLEGYGYVGTPKVYQSPFYKAVIPSSEFIPTDDYLCNSWEEEEPYDFWTDLEDPSREDPLGQIVETYCDNHGIAGVSVVRPSGAPGAAAVVTVTADYPNQACKFFPMTTTIDVSLLIELDANFVATSRRPDVGDEVIFEDLSIGGVRCPATGAYHIYEWDFDGDGTPDTTTTVAYGDPAPISWTWSYTEELTYTPSLTITDWDEPAAENTEKKKDYIVVGAGGKFVTWSFAWGPDMFPKHFPDDAEEVALADLTDVPAEICGVYWADPVTETWKCFLWVDGEPVSVPAEDRIDTLTPGENYLVAVSGACEWQIPLP